MTVVNDGDSGHSGLWSYPHLEAARHQERITGGVRRFGKAFGHALAARGAHAVLADVDGEAAKLAASEMSGSNRFQLLATA